MWCSVYVIKNYVQAVLPVPVYVQRDAFKCSRMPLAFCIRRWWILMRVLTADFARKVVRF